MDAQYLYPYSFLVALLSSLVFIPFLIRNSARWGLVDDPTGDARKIHSNVIPRSGGLGIILSAALSVLIVLPADEPIFSYVLAAMVIAGFGLLDDLVELSPIQKIGGQALGVVIAMAGGMVVTDFPIFSDVPAWLIHVITFIFVLGVINGVNFSDGMDGLAAGTTLMALALIFVLALQTGHTTVAVIAVAVSAAVLGFLRFNTHPARIFMGDAGSQFLGFTVAWLAITLSQSDTSAMTSLMPLLILGLPVMDILQVVPVRINKKLPLAGPDKEHLHHQVAKLGFSQYEVVAIIYVLQAILLVGAYLLRDESDVFVLIAFMAFAVLTLGTIYIANVSEWKIRPLDSSDDRDKRVAIFRRLGVLHPYTGVFFIVLLALFFAFGALTSTAFSPNIIYVAIVWAAILLAAVLILPNNLRQLIGRIASYTTTIFIVWGMTISVDDGRLDFLINALFVGMTVLLLLSIRITRKKYFGLTTEDLLVALFIVALTPLLVVEFGDGSEVISAPFRICVLLYTSEYVLARGEKAVNRLIVISICALLLTGVNL